MELRHLRYFAAVAVHQHLGRAAAALHVAQQALSVQLRDLERELGVALFVRHARGMTLTPAGVEFLAYAREALEANARAVARVRGAADGPGRLRVELLRFTPAADALFGRAVRAFRAGHPHAELDLVPAPSLTDRAALREHRVDVGFQPGPVHAAGVAVTHVMPDATGGALLPADHLLARAPEVEPAALSAFPLISFPHAAHPAIVDRELAELRAHGWRGRLAREEGDPGVCAAMVRYGAGWVHAPLSLGAAPFPGTVLRPFPPGYAPVPFDLHAVTRAGEADPLAAAFLACLRAAQDRDAPDR